MNITKHENKNPNKKVYLIFKCIKNLMTHTDGNFTRQLENNTVDCN